MSTGDQKCVGFFWALSWYVGVKVTSNSQHGCAAALAQRVGGLAHILALIVVPGGLDEEGGISQSVGSYVSYVGHML